MAESHRQQRVAERIRKILSAELAKSNFSDAVLDKQPITITHLDPSPEQAALAKAAWVPFGGGARNCIGFALAQIELTLILARLAQRIELEAPDDEIPPAVGMVVNRPAGGAPLRVTGRV